MIHRHPGFCMVPGLPSCSMEETVSVISLEELNCSMPALTASQEPGTSQLEGSAATVLAQALRTLESQALHQIV